VDNALSWFNPRYGSRTLRGKVEIKVCNMQSQQTGTEPEYNDLVRFLPWEVCQLVSKAEHFSGLLRNSYPIGHKEARGAGGNGGTRYISSVWPDHRVWDTPG